MQESLLEQGGVSYTVENGIGHIEFYHPKSNSLPGKVLKQLAETIQSAGADTESKVLVLRSKGEGAFCAGASFDELISIEDFETGKEFFMGFARVINAARKCPKFIIGRVHGKAVGGGVGLAAAVDYCLATEHSSVKLSELAVGIGPFVVGPAVERKIGTSAMSMLAINATEWRSPRWAWDMGLYAHVYHNILELDEAIAELATKLAASNPEAMAELKKVFWEGTENWDELLETRAEKSGRLVLSDFTVNAINKFKQK